MAVKKQNRPENRFETYTAFAKLQVELTAKFIDDTVVTSHPYGKVLAAKVIGDMVDARAHLLTFNGCDVFDDVQYKSRINFQLKALEDLNKVKASVETMIDLDNGKSATKYASIFKSLASIDTKIRHLMSSDKYRHSKGREAIAAEYADDRKHDFYKPTEVDHASNDESVLESADPLGISEFVFEPK